MSIKDYLDNCEEVDLFEDLSWFDKRINDILVWFFILWHNIKTIFKRG